MSNHTSIYLEMLSSESYVLMLLFQRQICLQFAAVIVFTITASVGMFTGENKTLRFEF